MEKMLEKVKYSFVLPAYKAKYLNEAIDSILNQTYKDFELIIVNDASPEDIDSIVKRYDDDRIQYYCNEKNLGGTDLIAQWNHSITYAKGEYIGFVDSDDWVNESAYMQILAKLRELVHHGTPVDMFISNFVYEKEGEKRVFQKRNAFYKSK